MPLFLPPGLDASEYRAKLLHIDSQMPFRVFTETKRGFRAAQAVGVVRAGRLEVEILPKVAAGSTYSADARFMFDLLVEAGLLPRLQVSKGDSAIVEAGILEVLIHWFAQEIWRRLLAGIPRRYAERREWSTTVRGKIEFGRLARRGPGRDHLTPIVHAPLQRDNLLTQVIMGVIRTLSAVTTSGRSRRKLQEAEALLHGVSQTALTHELLNQLELTRYEADWRPTILLANAILNGNAPNPAAGGALDSFTLLFSLHDVFERLLRKILPVSLDRRTLEYLPSPRSLNLLRSVDSRVEIHALRPDYVFTSRATNTRALVADAKWKRLQHQIESLGLGSEDLYQVATYMARHAVSRGALLFPIDSSVHPGQLSQNGWSRRFEFIGGGGYITVVGVDTAGLVSQSEVRRRKARDNLARSLEDAAH